MKVEVNLSAGDGGRQGSWRMLLRIAWIPFWLAGKAVEHPPRSPKAAYVSRGRAAQPRRAFSTSEFTSPPTRIAMPLR